ncbi:uncharacterized protein [Dysidea avara]|uniref:uncharacterized protein isoform X2 n=1 Tax=Dysidea avara TaxID=196820 RepID=UPI00331F5DBF
MERLCNSAYCGKLEDVIKYLDSGVDINGQDWSNEGDTSLHCAAQWGHLEVVKLLLSRGANVNSVNKSGDTPLHKAAQWGHRIIAERLLSKGADPDSVNKTGDTPSKLAAKYGVKISFKHQQIIFQQKKKQVVAVLEKGLNKAKAKGETVPVRFVKILFTGSGAAGKTSFNNLLMKKTINKFHHSTNVVQAKHAISMKKAIVLEAKQSKNRSVVWLEMDSDSEIIYLRQVLLSSRKPAAVTQKRPTSNNQQNEVSRNTPQQINNAVEVQSNALSNQVKKPPLLSQSVGKRVASIFSNTVKIRSKNLGTFDDLVQSALHSGTSLNEVVYHPGEVLNIITLLDTGGQPEYIHLLPTVNIHPMVTFVVHDLSKSLEDQVLVEYSEHGEHMFEPYHLRYSNFDVIKFLMSTINDSLERPACQVPQLVTIPGRNTNSYLCCVGTHADEVSSESMNNTDNKLTAMVEKLDCKAAVWPNKDGGVLFSVDNTTAGNDSKEDPIAEYIRGKIDLLASDKDVYELPITWMLLELEICQVCLSYNKAYISFEDCIYIASQSKLITDVDQVKSALLYHHLLGVLLYYPDVPGLCDYVIVGHQWLFDRLSSIVRFTFKKSSNLNASKKLKYNGILCKELIEELKWEEELKEEYFISLLVEMKIIAPIHREDGSGEDYFIPYILPTYTSQSQGDDTLSQYGYLQGEPLLIQFVSNLLPRGFFCCLVVQLLQCLPDGWNHVLAQGDTYHTYSNLISFSLPHGYLLSLLDKLSYLEVEIRHERELYYRQVSIHLAVQDVLADALQGVCEQLNYNHGRLQYGFHCQCGGFNEEHIAVLTTMTPPFDYARCGHGNVKRMNLKSAHRIWLTEDSNYCNDTVISADVTDSGLKQDCECHQSTEYKLFTDYYSKLVDTLPASDLSHYFVSDRVISLADHEEIMKSLTRQKAARLILDRVSHQLQNGNSTVFNKMLLIMEHHGIATAKIVAGEIRKKLIEVECIVNCSGQDSNYQSVSTQAGAVRSAPSSDPPNESDLHSAEYEVFIQYFSQIVNSLSVQSLSAHFVAQNIISQEDQLEILSVTSPRKAVSFLLSRISSAVEAGVNESFYRFLDITEKYGSIDNRNISLAIKGKLLRCKESICKMKGNEEFTAIAKYSYYPEAQGELELVVGDEVIVLEELKDGWWRGRVGQNEGVFPSNMVDELSPVLTTPTDKVEQLSSSNKTRCGHYPQADSELELAVGDEVVLEEVEDGWLSGRIGQTEEVLPRIFAPNTSSNKLEQPSST